MHERQLNTRLRFSRFAHFVEVNDYTTVYNSLNFGVVFVKMEIMPILERFLDGAFVGSVINEVSQGQRTTLLALLTQLSKQQSLVELEYEDLEDLRRWSDALEKLPLSILYLLLTERCNFACDYCVIKGGIPASHRQLLMTPRTVKEGVDLFARCLQEDPLNADGQKQIVFYGGEPLVNIEALTYGLGYIDYLRKREELPQELGLALNTNASLITEEVAQLLARHRVGVAVSIDGRREEHDLFRKYPSGRGTFEDVVQGVRLLQQAGAKVSISCTIGKHNLDSLEETLLWLVEEFGVKSLGFNMLLDSEAFKVSDLPTYSAKASQAIISCFKLARQKGIYEARIMRKVQAFADGRIYPNDCAGCGQQLVIAPDGKVGVCHAFCGTGEYFVEPTSDFDPRTHPIWVEWRDRSPLAMSQCTDCIALGICGGGCSHNAYVRSGSIWALDEAFCIHAKMILKFLIRDLFEKVIEGAKFSS